MNINGVGSGSSGTDYSRITGLATGMDIDGMVKGMLARDRARMDKVGQDRQYLQWQQEAYVDIIKDLKDFNNYFDILKADNMIGSSNYTGTKVVSSKENVLNATTLPGAVKGLYEVKVANLAESAKAQGSFSPLNSGKITNTNGADWQNKTITFSVDGKEIKITLDNMVNPDGSAAATTLDGIVQKIQEKINTTELKDKLTLSAENGTIHFQGAGSQDIVLKDTTLKNLAALKDKSITSFNRNSKLSDLGITAGNFRVTVKGTEFTVNIDNTKSIDDIVTDIKNTQLPSGESLGNFINVSFSDLTKKLTIESKYTGSKEALTITSGTSNFADKTGLTGEFTGINAKVSIKAPGENAFVEVEKESNNFNIDGMSYNLIKPTGDESIELTVTSDATASVDKFKKFIEKYNALVEKINTKVSEKKEYKFKPLTEEQRKSMKEDEIKSWEEKAKQGMLKRDGDLSQILSDLRSAVYNAVEGSGITMTELGITTTSKYMDGGKLEIDETKLKAALENKGDLVQKLFTQTGDKYESQGVFTRFKKIINDNIGFDGTLIKKAGSKDTRWVSENDLSKRITEKNTVLKDLERKFFVKQEALYRRFATLEKNMNSLNSQSNWLYSQMGAS
ncbi:flagellar hook-associated protein 2 [Clostridium amylolyticum]|uniref:Flagellar hook-associated protein 2 n=1 Tax=Clostridium amylolyticum TaxID=1121298 RepID=A0A1M6CDH0_9CLOT|nr:flagellar filament capping protein FliD [Clostridium amylolyticum]SHI59062.1 flagellar hook-associated protein 2 [Clostridium amylolyticum]